MSPTWTCSAAPRQTHGPLSDRSASSSSRTSRPVFFRMASAAPRKSKDGAGVCGGSGMLRGVRLTQ